MVVVVVTSVDQRRSLASPIPLHVLNGAMVSGKQHLVTIAVHDSRLLPGDLTIITGSHKTRGLTAMHYDETRQEQLGHVAYRHITFQPGCMSRYPWTVPSTSGLMIYSINNFSLIAQLMQGI